MKRSTLAMTCAMTGLILGLTAAFATADGDHNKRLSVTVSFGAGLNTSGQANQHVLPKQIKVKSGGVVNFVVAGFHQVFVYNPGTSPEDIAVPASGAFINDLRNIYYQGLSPAGTPPPGLSNTQNRVESVSFEQPGKYLVICNVTSHFRNGMFGFVKVSDDDDED